MPPSGCSCGPDTAPENEPLQNAVEFGQSWDLPPSRIPQPALSYGVVWREICFSSRTLQSTDKRIARPLPLIFPWTRVRRAEGLPCSMSAPMCHAQTGLKPRGTTFLRAKKCSFTRGGRCWDAGQLKNKHLPLQRGSGGLESKAGASSAHRKDVVALVQSE